jgi:nitroreductase
LPVPHSVEYFGKASVIDPRPMYLWSVIWDVAQATRSDGLSSMRARKHISSSEHRAPPRLISTRSAETVLLGRRSAQRFDPEHSLTADAFYAFLAAVMPNAPGTWHALPHAPSLDLIVFVHRVEGLQPGLYVLPRRGEQSAILVEQLARQYTLHPASLHDHHVPLQQLCVGEPEELKRVSRAVHCHQDIAATSLFALGMVADLEVQLSDHPSHYRALYREAGLIGQALYLQAEMQGLRGTGIGCYFDDAVHELFGLLNTHHQSLYHFTVGRGLEDARIETARAYPGRPNAP